MKYIDKKVLVEFDDEDRDNLKVLLRSAKFTHAEYEFDYYSGGDETPVWNFIESLCESMNIDNPWDEAPAATNNTPATGEKEM